MTITREQIIEQLRRVKGPDLKDDIISLGLVSEVVISDGKVMFSIAVDPARAAALEPLRQAAEKAVSLLPGVTQVLATLTADRPAGTPPPQRPARPAAPRLHPSGPSAPQQQQQPQQQQPPGIPGVKAIIAIASGKGGVGKSTTACNFALALQANGLRVGVLDADIYGPSLPRLLGVTTRIDKSQNRTLAPLDAYGLKVMSMGFLVEEDRPMIWRGPMVISALTEMLRNVAWGELDALVVDMPPGTGDAQLTLAQQTPLAGAIIVSTPQDLSLIDARKGLNMFRRVDVPVLGIVENMSYFVCPHCGGRSHVFGHGGARHEAERLGVPFLGEVPLHMTIRETSDAGRPVVATEPDGIHARIYREIAAQAWDEVERNRGGSTKPPPRIVIEA